MHEGWGQPSPELEHAHERLAQLIGTARQTRDFDARERLLARLEEVAASASERERMLQQRRDFLTALADDLALISETGTLCSLIVERTAQALGADRVAIALADRVPGKLVLLASHGVPATRVARYSVFPADEDLPLALAHTQREPAPFDNVDGCHGASVPLLVGEHSLGAIGVGFAGARALDGDGQRLLDAIARQTACAVERTELLARAQRETERVRFLVRAGDLLSSTTDVRATLATLVRLAVPALADWAAVDLFVDDDTVDRVAVAHVDPEKVVLAEDLVRAYPPDLARPDWLGRIRQTGEPQYVSDIPDEALAAIAKDARHLELMRRLELHSYVAVPIRGRVRGAFTLIGAESGRRYGPEDMRFATEIAQRAAIALTAAETMDDLRRAEHAAKDAWDRLQHHLESSPAAVVELDANLRVTRWSDEARRVFGWDAEYVFGGPLGTWAWLDASEQHKLEHVIDDMNAGARVRAVLPTRSRRKDGGLVWCEWYVSGVRGEDGRLASVLCLILDVTDRVRAQQALEESDRRKDEFLAMLGHELRNPVGAIANATRVLDLVHSGGRRQQSALAVIKRQVGYVKHLLDDLLDVARISRGKLSIEREVVDLRTVVRESVTDHRPAARDAQLEIDTHIAAEPVTVWGDKMRLAQALSNLLHNATKFTPAGGRITVTLHARKSTAVLRVEDNGIGVEPDEISRLFEPFTQASPRDRARGGLGLGLALVKGVVGLHGGSVHARSAGSGRGTTFEIELPLASAAPRKARSDVAGAAPALRVLLVEDDADSREMLGMLLSALGHEVHLATNGADAVSMARSADADLVLCDLGLPGELDGYAVAEALRADTSLRQPYLVAVSGYGLPEHVQKARLSGFDEHATKPLTAEKLGELLRAASRTSASG